MSPTKQRPARPYKFLEPFTHDDLAIFVGREREAETLVGDVIASRLVVLFAKTGTGKTSLINAGVRPRLEALDYRTLYVRVENDPTEAVRAALISRRMLTRDRRDEPLPEQLRRAGSRRPIVVFFDQFEEFFIHFGGAGLQEPIRSFIADIADVYRDRASGVHVVFSMREEYFVEMDAFRDEIPAIFHNESSLRLRPLDVDQALEAIVRPAHALEVELEDGLPELIVADLEEDGVVEPARLQIVCDTLWREGARRAMSINDYERLGGAEAIVTGRLEQDLKALDERRLRLLELVFPKLRTDYGTKYRRGVHELAEAVGVERKSLEDLFATLKEAHLVSESTINRSKYVEWASDYVAARTERLLRWTRTLLDRRIFEAAVEQVRAAGPTDLSKLETILPLATEDFERISEHPSELTLNADEARLGLLAALVHGVGEHAWFDASREAGVDVWALLREVLSERRMPQAGEHVLGLLVEIADEPDAFRLLEESLDEPALAPSAFDALARLRGDDRAADVIARQLEDEARASKAIDALRRLGTPRSIELLGEALLGGGAVGIRAGTALGTLAGEPAGLGRAPRAQEVLADAFDQRGAALLEEALRQGVPARFWFDRAAEHGADVWSILEDAVGDTAADPQLAFGAGNLLAELEDSRAAELLRSAAAQPHLREPAERALKAHAELEQLREERAPKQAPARRRDGAGLRVADWERLLYHIREGRCLPILGPGVNVGLVPSHAEIARRLAYSSDLPTDATDLGQVSALLELETDFMYAREHVAQIIRDVPDGSSGNGSAHDLLAALPCQLYLTINYDALLERALARRDRTPFVVTYPRSDRERYELNSRLAEVLIDRRDPVVLHLHGEASNPESLVLTEDDHIDFIGSISREGLPPTVGERLVSGAVLILGMSPHDFAWRALLRTVLMQRERFERYELITFSPTDRENDRRFELEARRRNFRVYWGTPSEFAAELEARWTAFAGRS